MYVLHVAVARSFSDGIAICYVLPILWMTLYFHIMEDTGLNQIRRVCFVQFFVTFLALWTSLVGRARTDPVQSRHQSLPLSSQHGASVSVWNVHARCYLNMSSGSSVSHHQQLGYSTSQTSDVWLSRLQRRRSSLLEWSTRLSQVTWPLTRLFQTST